MSRRAPRGKGIRGRRLARERALQALYQWQLQGQPIKDVCNQFIADEQGDALDVAYFKEVLLGVGDQHSDIDARISEFADRDLGQLDPVEHAILWIGFYELLHKIDVPYRVVLNEAVELARAFGAEDGHKYVNAVMDRAAAELRALERRA